MPALGHVTAFLQITSVSWSVRETKLWPARHTKTFHRPTNAHGCKVHLFWEFIKQPRLNQRDSRLASPRNSTDETVCYFLWNWEMFKQKLNEQRTATWTDHWPAIRKIGGCSWTVAHATNSMDDSVARVSLKHGTRLCDQFPEVSHLERRRTGWHFGHLGSQRRGAVGNGPLKAIWKIKRKRIGLNSGRWSIRIIMEMVHYSDVVDCIADIHWQLVLASVIRWWLFRPLGSVSWVSPSTPLHRLRFT